MNPEPLLNELHLTALFLLALIAINQAPAILEAFERWKTKQRRPKP